MSGGSYDYVSGRLADAASTLRSRHATETHVVALARLIDAIADVMHDIEWADSSDTTWDDALDAKIRTIISPTDELAVAVEQATQAEHNLRAALAAADARGPVGRGVEAER